MATEFYNRNWRMPNSWNGSTDNNSKVSNYSMSFDGTEFIDTNSTFNTLTSFSISAWFKADDTAGTVRSIVSTRANGLSTSKGLDIYISGNVLTGRVYDNGATEVTQSFTDTSSWHNVVMTYDGTTLELFLDNSSIGTATGSYDSTGATNLIIGKFTVASSYYFSGKIDHVAIFDYVLSDQQILDLQGSSSTGVGNPMAISGGRKPIAYYPIGDYAAFNGSEYLVPNGALQDYNLKINPANLNQGFVISEDYGYSAFTISMWVNQDFVGRTIWVNEDTTGANTEKISISINANSFLVFNCQGGGDSYTLSTQHNLTGDDRLFGTNRWINITAVYTGTDMILYGNANSGNFVSVSASNYPAGGTVPSSITLAQNQTIIGKANLAGLSEFRGQISNFSVFDTALPETGSESATSLFNNGTPANISSYSNLQGWWQFNADSTFDSAAGIWTSPDSSSNNNSAVGNFPNSWEKMESSYLVQSDLNITTPYSRYALDFDGTGDYIDLGTGTDFNFTGPFTLSVWAKKTGTGSGSLPTLFNSPKNSSQQGGYILCEVSNRWRFYVFDSGTSNWKISQADNTIVNDSWYNITAIYDGSIIKLYVNKDLQADTETVTSVQYTGVNQNAFIGKYINSHYFNGEISNVSIWNTELTTSQITEIYNQGKPGNLNNHSAYSNLVSWWQLGENMSYDSNVWTVLDEKGTNNGTGANLAPAEDSIVNGVGTSANGLSDGMGGADNIIGDAPYSTSNAVSYGMGVDARVSGSGNVPS